MDTKPGSFAKTNPPSAAWTILFAYILAQAKSPMLPSNLETIKKIVQLVSCPANRLFNLITGQI